MTIETIAPRAGRRGLLASATAWVWPQPRQSEDRRGGGVWMGVLASLWPSRVGDAGHGRRRGLMAVLFGWVWPAGLDRSLRRWWRASWLWSWIWPGRVMGPHGEICPLAPWHPVVSQGAGRRGGILAMIAAFAVAAPTFMVNDNVPDGGRLNLFRSGGTAQDGGAPAGGQTTDAGLGGVGGGAGGGGNSGRAGPTGDFAPTPEGPEGLVGGDGTGQPGPPDVGGDPGLTVIDVPPGVGDDLAPESGLSPFIGGGGGSGGAGGGGGGGGGQPTDPPGGDDPATPPGETPPGVNPPAVDPPGPFLPTPPNVPGGGSNPPGTIKPPNQFSPDPPFIEDPRGPGGDDPIDNTGPRDNEPIGAVPEPGTWALMILGFGGVGYAIRRRRFAVSVG